MAPVWNKGQYPKIGDWFNMEILKPRVADIALRSLLLCTLLEMVALMAVAVARQPLNPLSWVTAPLHALLAPSSWLYDVLVAAATIGSAALFVRNFSLAPARGWGALSSSLRGPAAASLAGHALASAVLVRCYLGLTGGAYSSLTAQCPLGGSRRCLNDPHVFLVMSGLYFGLSHWFRLHVCHESLVTFPPVQLHGSTQIRLRFGAIAVRAFKACARDLRWFYLFYFAYGHRFSSFLSSTFRLELLPSGDGWMSRLSGHVWLLGLCLALNTFAAVSVRLAWEINRIGLRKPVRLTLEEMVEAMRQENKAGARDVDLLRHLAFQDFLSLATGPKERREEVFELSQPGGHPHNWNNLSGAALKAIDEFIAGLNEASNSSNNNSTAAAAPKKKPADGEPAKPASAAKKLWAKARQLPANLFSSRQPEELARAKFAQGQVAIWASEGLAYLVAASAFEDRFGVVQKSLSDVLYTLLNLQKTVERHKGLTAPHHRSKGRFSEPLAEEEGRDHQLKQELRVSVRTSLYRICTTFGDHILAVPLSSEHKQKLESYKNFTEGRAG